MMARNEYEIGAYVGENAGETSVYVGENAGDSPQEHIVELLPSNLTPSAAKLAEKLGLSKRHVERLLAELRDAGAVERLILARNIASRVSSVGWYSAGKSAICNQRAAYSTLLSRRI